MYFHFIHMILHLVCEQVLAVLSPLYSCAAFRSCLSLSFAAPLMLTPAPPSIKGYSSLISPISYPLLSFAALLSTVCYAMHTNECLALISSFTHTHRAVTGREDNRCDNSIMHHLLLVSCSTGIAMSLLLHPAYRSLDVPAGREIESLGLYVPLRGLDEGLCLAGLPIGCISSLAAHDSTSNESQSERAAGNPGSRGILSAPLHFSLATAQTCAFTGPEKFNKQLHHGCEFRTGERELEECLCERDCSSGSGGCC